MRHKVTLSGNKVTVVRYVEFVKYTVELWDKSQLQKGTITRKKVKKKIET